MNRALLVFLLAAALAACSSSTTDPPDGDPRTGDPNSASGDPVAGDPLAGDPLAGDPLAGDPLAGDPLAGDPLAGDPLAGDPLAGDPIAAPEFCDGSTFAFYTPADDYLDTFPDDFFTVADGTTATGLRVNMSSAILPTNLASHDEVVADISTLDGFGVNARAYVSFSGALDTATLPSIADSDSASSSVLLVNLDTGALVEFEAEELTSPSEYTKSTLLITPVHSLAPKTQYGLVVLRTLHDAAGNCIEPYAEMKALLTRTATDAAYTRLHTRYQTLVTFLENQSLIDHVTDISHAVVFTTQSTTDQSESVATTIAGLSSTLTYNSLGACSSTSDYELCEGELLVSDYRTNHDHIANDMVPASPPYTNQSLKVATYLPLGTGPHPTVIYGHGLGGDRHQAQTLAQVLCPLDIAVVAVDAVKHGDHYDAGGSGATLVLDMFGITYGPPAVLDIRAARDNFRQSAYDKLHLLKFILNNHDVDGDATNDFDSTNLAYVGVSLGGIMGAEFVALSPQLDAYATIVSGARLVDIIATIQVDLGAPFGVVSVADALFPSATAAERARFFPLMQTVLDRGDSGSYAGHVLLDRLSDFDSASPHVLMQMAENDQVVPNIANTYYARELGLPILGTVIVPIYGVGGILTYPVSLNISGTPAHTAGVQQFDQLSGGGAATHEGLPADDIALPQTRDFINTSFTGTATINEP